MTALLRTFRDKTKHNLCILNEFLNKKCQSKYLMNSDLTAALEHFLLCTVS